MENRSLFIVYLVTWLLYVVGIHWYGSWRRLDKGSVGVSHAAPSLVAVSMAYIFLIEHGATVRQFVAYSDRGMDLWSLWCCLWPLLLLVAFAGGVAQTILTVVVSVKREWRMWIPVTALGAGMCGFSFMTVLSNFPDA